MIKTVDSQLIVVLITIAGFYGVPCQADEYVVFGAGEHDLGYSGDSGLEEAEMAVLEVDTDRGMMNPSKWMGGNRDDDDYYGLYLILAGYAPAQSNLDVIYDRGRGVPRNDAKAVQWYRKSAEQGDAEAQFNLGVMYDKGRGVPQDDAKAVKWYRRSAKQGFAPAQYNLGFMYVEGQSVSQDHVRAYMWFDLAGAFGDKNARKGRALAAVEMTSAQIAEAQKLAREWMQNHQAQ